jgi:hypothetical protein
MIGVEPLREAAAPPLRLLRMLPPFAARRRGLAGCFSALVQAYRQTTCDVPPFAAAVGPAFSSFLIRANLARRRHPHKLLATPFQAIRKLFHRSRIRPVAAKQMA